MCVYTYMYTYIYINIYTYIYIDEHNTKNLQCILSKTSTTH